MAEPGGNPAARRAPKAHFVTRYAAVTVLYELATAALYPDSGTSIDLTDLELCDGAPAAQPRHRPAVAVPTGQRPAHIRGNPVAGPAAPARPEPIPHEPADGEDRLPGSRGEHLLQASFGTQDRAKRFYADQVLDHLNPAMVEFVKRMEMIFIATADASGECDASLRAGPAGFVQVLSPREIAYPEYRGNGVLASLGNISENPHVGLLMVDFVTDLIGLHVNGTARVLTDAELRRRCPALPVDHERGRVPERWVAIEVAEAYIHCRKHIPRMTPVVRQRAWGTDDVRRKGGDFFEAKATKAAQAAG